jgi:hypothetical protein
MAAIQTTTAQPVSGLKYKPALRRKHTAESLKFPGQ